MKNFFLFKLPILCTFIPSNVCIWSILLIKEKELYSDTWFKLSKLRHLCHIWTHVAFLGCQQKNQKLLKLECSNCYYVILKSSSGKHLDCLHLHNRQISRKKNWRSIMVDFTNTKQRFFLYWYFHREISGM